MDFEFTTINGRPRVRFRDSESGLFILKHYLDGDVGIEPGPAGTTPLCMDRDIARRLGRILIDYADRGDLSGAEAIVVGDGAGPQPPGRDGGLSVRVESLEQRLADLDGLARYHHGQAIEIGDRLKAVEQAMADRQKPEPTKTPQEIADDMTARFPAGTRVSALHVASGSMSVGVVDSPFAVEPGGGYVVWVKAERSGRRHLTCHVVAAEPSRDYVAPPF